MGNIQQAYLDLARQAQAQATAGAANQRAAIQDAYNRQRELVAPQLERANAIALARRGISAATPYGQRMLSDLQGDRYDALATREAHDLARVADNGQGLSAMFQALGLMGDQARLQQQMEMDRQRMAMAQEAHNMQMEQARAAQQAGQRAATTSLTYSPNRHPVAYPTATPRARVQPPAAHPVGNGGVRLSELGSYNPMNLPGGVRGGGLLIGSPQPESPRASLFAPNSQQRYRDATRNMGPQASLERGAGGQPFTGVGVGIGPLQVPGMTPARQMPGGWMPLSQMGPESPIGY